jgi:hypothetical protein
MKIINHDEKEGKVMLKQEFSSQRKKPYQKVRGG